MIVRESIVEDPHYFVNPQPITYRKPIYISIILKGNGMFLYSAVSSLLDRSKHFTLHYPADLFIPAPTRRLCEAFRHAAITREDYSLTFPPLCIARYSFIQLSELGCPGENENAQTLKWYQRGIQTGTLSIASPELYR